MSSGSSPYPQKYTLLLPCCIPSHLVRSGAHDSSAVRAEPGIFRRRKAKHETLVQGEQPCLAVGNHRMYYRNTAISGTATP